MPAQFDEYGANILEHCQQHAPYLFSLLLFAQYFGAGAGTFTEVL